MYGEYKEYHTSLDNKSFISFKVILQTIKIYYDVLLTLENNFTPYGKVQYGTPQLSKSKIDLYPKMMDFVDKPKDKWVHLMLEILNLSDGDLDLIDICNKKGYRLIDYLDLFEKLIKAKYIKKMK